MELIDPNKFIKEHKLSPITSPSILEKGSFSKNGLFSETIFGPQDGLKYKKERAYIELNCRIINPHLFRIIKELDRKLFGLITCQNKYILNEENLLEVDSEGDLFGLQSFESIFKKYNYRPTSIERKKKLQILIHNANRKTLFIDKIIVIPPGIRPVTLTDEGDIKFSDAINDFYIKIIALSNRIKNIGRSGPVYNIELARMQMLVFSLFEYEKEKISKKNGYIRSNLLGKRIDYSGRAVISGDPTLTPDKVRLPMKMAIKLFSLFLIHEILNNYSEERKAQIKEMIVKNGIGDALTIAYLNSLFATIYKNEAKLSKEDRVLLVDMCNEVVQKDDKVVLLKRDPTLHRGSVKSFRPIITDHEAIGLYPPICKPFNADFDGDQMAVYLPLSVEAQADARELLIHPDDSASMKNHTYSYGLEFIAGAYAMTMDPPGNPEKPKSAKKIYSLDELKKENNYYEYVDYQNNIATVGRQLINSLRPEKAPFMDKVFRDKDLAQYVDLLSEHPGFQKKFKELSDMIREAATQSPLSYSISDLEIPDELKRELKEVRKIQDPNEKIRAMEALKNKVKEYINNNDFGRIVDSGTKGDMTQISQMMIEKGDVVDIIDQDAGHIDSSFMSGLSAKEFYIGGYGARKGMSDKTLTTATFGYLSRQLLYALSGVEVSSDTYDCGTTQYFPVEVTDDIAKRIVLRNYVDKKGNVHFIKPGDEKSLVGKTINLRSPIYCRSKEICQVCAGTVHEKLKTNKIGIIAAQTFGERGTQNIMKAFHLGGVSLKMALDLKKQIISNNKKIAEDYDKIFYQKNNDLYCQSQFEIIVDLNRFRDAQYSFDDNTLWLMYSFFKLKFGGKEYSIAIDQPIYIFSKHIIRREEDNTIRLQYFKDERVLQSEGITGDIKANINKTLRFFHASFQFNNVEEYLWEFYKIYSKITSCFLLYFELLASEVFRLQDDKMKLARLHPEIKNVVGVNIKDIPYLGSTFAGFMYENPSKSITNNLYRGISGQKEEPTIIEKIALGKL